LLLAVQVGLLIAWQCTSLVPGFCPIENATTFNAVCHTGWWLAIEFVVLAVGAAAPCMDLWVVEYTQGVRKQTSVTQKWIIAWIVLLFIAIVSNIIHLVASGIEYFMGCTTTMCLSYASYLLAFICILIFLLCLEILLLIRVFVYLKDLKLIQGAMTAPPPAIKTNIHRLKV
jgi:hypothetical protein